VKLFHRTNLLGKDIRPVYLRVEDIQGVFPDDDGGCSVVMRGSRADLYLAESAQEVAAARGYNPAPEPGSPTLNLPESASLNPDASLILAGALRAQFEKARSAAGATDDWRAKGYADGLKRAVDIAEGRA